MAKRKGTLDPFHLDRFVEAQAPVFERVRAELAAGEKRTHWMWFIFPQVRGLGSSFMAQRFALSGLDEAGAYLRHPLLGPRLRECTRLVNAQHGRSVGEILGSPDDLKFRSSMTLFAEAAAKHGLSSDLFQEALTLFFAGEPDGATLAQLAQR